MRDLEILRNGGVAHPHDNKFHVGNGSDGKPVDKWILMMLAAGAEVRNLGDVRWLATEDGSAGKGIGRHIAAFVLRAPRTNLEAHDG